MNRIITAAILLTFATAAGAQNRTRVGTFDAPSLVVAYYRSDAWSQQVKTKKAEQDRARQAGDTQKVADLEKWGSSQQELAHQQLTGQAPVTNILDELKPAMAEIAAAERVEAIAPNLLYSASNIEVVDVTDALVARFHPNQKTLSIIQDMRKQPPR